MRNNVDKASMFLNNNTSTNIIQTDNVRMFRSDGAYPARTVTTGGGGLDVVWRNTILIAETGVSGLTTAESNQLASIVDVKTTTDTLTGVPSNLYALSSMPTELSAVSADVNLLSGVPSTLYSLSGIPDTLTIMSLQTTLIPALL